MTIEDCVCRPGMLNICCILSPCHTWCQAGFELYYPDWLQCLPCPAGHHCPWNTSVAAPCPTGEELLPGTASCSCPLGMHGTQSHASCQPCDAWYYCPGGTLSVQCPPHTASVNHSKSLGDFRCDPGYAADGHPCPEGSYCPGDGARDCPQHSRTLLPGASAVTQCVCRDGTALAWNGSVGSRTVATSRAFPACQLRAGGVTQNARVEAPRSAHTVQFRIGTCWRVAEERAGRPQAQKWSVGQGVHTKS
eukprot:3215340-Rhodomonas_salina.2